MKLFFSGETVKDPASTEKSAGAFLYPFSGGETMADRIKGITIELDVNNSTFIEACFEAYMLDFFAT